MYGSCPLLQQPQHRKHMYSEPPPNQVHGHWVHVRLRWFALLYLPIAVVVAILSHSSLTSSETLLPPRPPPQPFRHPRAPSRDDSRCRDRLPIPGLGPIAPVRLSHLRRVHRGAHAREVRRPLRLLSESPGIGCDRL